MRVLITGASGFIGSHIADEALRQGMDVWCAVRKTSSRKYLQDSRLHFIEVQSPLCLPQTDDVPEFDVVIHAAGATKCRNRDDFFRNNTDGTRALIESLKGKPRFIMMSSYSVRYNDTAYAQSKLAAEEVVKASPLPYVILRPTGVYGPREKDYFLMVQSITQHVDFAVGYSPQIITFVYVDDVVQAVMKSISGNEADVCGRTYNLSDGEDYESRTFSDYIIEELGHPWCLRIKAPLFVLKAVCFCGEWYNRLTGSLITLNKDKYNILAQRDWRCDITDARKYLGYEPTVTLKEGTRRIVKWYKENKWI